MRSRKRFAIDHHLRGALPYHLRPPTGHSNGGPFEDSPSSCHYLFEILSAQKLEQRQEQRRAQEQRPGAAARALAGARFSGRQTKKAAELEATDMVKLTKNAAAGGTYDNDDDATVSDNAF